MTSNHSLIFMQLHIIATCLICLLGVFNYVFIVKQRGMSTSFLFGYGFMIPLGLNIPFAMIRFFQVENKFMAQGLTEAAIMTVFRTMEAMHATGPAVVEYSLANYVAYYSSFTFALWDDKTKKRVSIDFVQGVKTFLWTSFWYNVVAAMLSVLLHYDFLVFLSPIQLDHFAFTQDLLHWGHLANMYILACKFCLGVSLNSHGQILSFSDCW